MQMMMHNGRLQLNEMICSARVRLTGITLHLFPAEYLQSITRPLKSDFIFFAGLYLRRRELLAIGINHGKAYSSDVATLQLQMLMYSMELSRCTRNGALGWAYAPSCL
jgi:hypothetical protein